MARRHAGVDHRASDVVEIENVRVLVRIRPLTKRERRYSAKRAVAMDLTRTELTVCNAKLQTQYRYNFHQIFGERDTQRCVFEHVAAPLVIKTLEGYNATVFTYGQTGTGKTYTMTGVYGDPQHQGLVPNVVQNLFERIRRSPDQIQYAITVTYIEIYNEEIRDLLTEADKKLTLHERPAIGVYVKNLTGYTVDSVNSVTSLIMRGNRNRIVRATNINSVSSRSHTILTIRIESKDSSKSQISRSKLNLVDLAGSERWKRSETSGNAAKETININQSLFVLGNVISALVDSRNTFVPYRNSKLTRLLQDSLGGNSKTAMIATVSPTEHDYDETVCTLRYATRVKNIQNAARCNVEMNKGLIDTFEEEIDTLRQKLHTLTVREMKPANKKLKRKEYEELTQQQLNQIREKEQEKSELLDRISTIQQKILGGHLSSDDENAAVTAEQDLHVLEEREARIEEDLYLREQEREEIELHCTSLEEESGLIQLKLQMVQERLCNERIYHAEKEVEYRREIENVQYDNKKLFQELQLANFIIEHYVPRPYLAALMQNITWDKDADDYSVRNVPFTGNALRAEQSPAMLQHEQQQQQQQHGDAQRNGVVTRDLICVYRKYGDENVRKIRPRSAQSQRVLPTSIDSIDTV